MELCALVSAAHAQDHSPQLLLTSQRLRRLQRDRERQTVRWQNFEARVNTVPDSLERGFEVALYYAITHDEKRGREAVDWALAHRCERRQAALIADWCGGLASERELKNLLAADCGIADRANDIGRIRDELFLRIARRESLPQPYTGKQVEQFGLTDPRKLYDACEYIDAVRRLQQIDVREDDAAFFRRLPAEFLLAMKPVEFEHPAWQAPIAGLALVSLDPNLESSQFLQGWAMEDRQMIQDGPGVAYELLWGDPYLPGVSYRNLDPWTYDGHGHLLARTDWHPDACWISISAQRTDEVNCGPHWREQPQMFENMTLIPMGSECVEAPPMKGTEAAMLWGLRPYEPLTYMSGKKRASGKADEAGLWLLPGYVKGTVCRQAETHASVRAPATLRFPR